MTLYLVQYHSNAWGDQESSDDILGIYDSEEKAEERAEKFRQEYAWKDDIVSVCEYELNEEIPSYREYMESLCE